MKHTLFFLISFLVIQNCNAQVINNYCAQFNPYSTNLFSADMNKLPKVSITIKDGRKLSGHLLLTTKKSDENGYNSSIQLFDLAAPELPAWFATINENKNNFFGDSKLLPNGNLSFYLKSDSLNFPLPKELGGDVQGIIDGYFELNKQLEPVDFFTAASIDNHDYKKFASGERIFLSAEGRELDLSAYTFKGQQLSKKTMVGCESIIILDKDNKASFYWNPLDHIDFSELDMASYENIIVHKKDMSLIQFSRTNSVNIDPFDGNILASFRRSDMCVKIDRATGKIIWRLGGKKSDFALNDTSRFYLQHDFTRIANGTYKGFYSLYNNGNENNPTTEGLIYELDETNKKVKSVLRFRNEIEVKSMGQGNFEVYTDGTCLVNNGNAVSADEKPNFITLFKKDTVVANISLPKNVLVYRAVWLKNFSIERPGVSVENTNGKVNVTANKSSVDVAWSTNDTSYNSTPSNTPVVFCKKPYGLGYVTSLPKQTANGIRANDVQFPIVKNRTGLVTAIEKCALTFNFNGLAYNFHKSLIDLEHVLMITQP